MPNKDLVFYSSENGDTWSLLGGAREGDTVRQLPNPSSGGASRDVELHDFLSREKNTPQGQALQRALEQEPS